MTTSMPLSTCCPTQEPWKLFYRTSQGMRYEISLTDEQLQRINQVLLEEKLTSVNITNCILTKKGGEIAQVTSEDPTIKKIEDVLSAVLKMGYRREKAIVSKNIRGVGTRPSFRREDPRLQTLKDLTYNDFAQLHKDKSIGEVLTSFKRFYVLKTSLKVLDRILEVQERRVSSQKPDTEEEKEAIQKELSRIFQIRERLKNVDSFALDFEALYPLDGTESNFSELLLAKKEAALELIQSKDIPNKRLVWMIPNPFKKQETKKEKEEQYANEMALLGIRDRKIYHEGKEALKAKETKDSLEHFLVRVLAFLEKGKDLQGLVQDAHSFGIALGDDEKQAFLEDLNLLQTAFLEFDVKGDISSEKIQEDTEDTWGSLREKTLEEVSFHVGRKMNDLISRAEIAANVERSWSRESVSEDELP